MKLFNLTDVATPELERRHLVGATLCVWQHIVQPGEMIDVLEEDKVLDAVRTYIEVGAMAVNTLPPSYVSMKEKLAPPPVPAEPPVNKKSKV